MQFLRGDFSGRAAPLRPPWSLREAAFVVACDRCGLCIERCPTRIIKRGRGGYPVVDFSAGECLLCGDCVAACKPQALRRSEGREAWTVRASIDAQVCLGYGGIECRSCADPCATRAIQMRPQVGGVAVPVLDNSLCNGCGACFSVCPVRAIDMRQQGLQEAQ